MADRGGPIKPVRPPAGAPNVVVVVIDDMGFGASSAYGGPCRMPTTERLAGGGLRYSRFHVTALCSPTRQALMTGRNHHSVGMGVTTEMATCEPGYTGFRPAAAATMAQILGGNGYATGAFGKWHQTPPVEISPSGPFTRWPTGEGFDHFYGFMGAEMNHWYPQLYADNTPVEPVRTPEQGYHLSEDLVEHAIDWIAAEQSVTPDQPFFCYLAFGATHAPFHVGSDWIEPYEGAFDEGWDAQREQILSRQRESGVVGPDAELSPWAPGVPHWDELSDTERKVAVRLMETYAGFAEHTDAQVGRLVEALERLDVLDDTMIVFLLGDNGASGEGGPEGTLREHLVGHGFADDPEWMARRLDRIGSADTYAIYPVGWALAMNTPYQWTKQVASHYGGTRDGLIVHWPNGIAARGEIRHQWHHVIDILPTVLEAAGLPEPTSVRGVEQQPIEGISFGYSFDSPEAPDRRSTQYFEMVGNRGIYHQGWTAVTQHGVPWLMTTAGARLRRRRLGALRHHRGLEPGPRSGRSAAGPAGRAAHVVRRRGRAAPGVPVGRPGDRTGEPAARRPDGSARRTDLDGLRSGLRPAQRRGRAQRQEPQPPDHRRAQRPGRQRFGRCKRGAVRPGRSVRWLVALSAPWPAQLCLQLLRPRSHGGPRGLGAGGR